MATGSNDVDLKIQAIVDGLENVAQLTSELGELERAGSEQVPDNTQELREGADETSGAMEGLRNNIGKVVAAGAALGGVAAALRSSIGEFTDYDTRLRSIDAVLEATGRSARITGEDIRQMSRDLALATLGSVEGFEGAAQQVLTFQSVSEEALPRVLGLAQDLAQSGFGSLESNARTLAMALDDPTEGLNRLRRQGIQFSEDQKAVIDSLIETGKEAEAQSLILDEITKRVGGVGEAAAEGLAGQFDTLSQRFEEFRVATGELIEPALTAFLDEVNGALEWMTENTDQVVRGAQALGLALTAIAGRRLIASLAATTAQIVAIGRSATTSAGAVRALGLAMRALPGTAAVALLSSVAFGLLSWRDAAREAREEQARLRDEAVESEGDFQRLQAQLDDTIISQENAGTAQEQLNRALEDGTVVVDEITGNYRRAGETLTELIEKSQAAARAQADLTRDDLAGAQRDQAAAIVEQGQALAGLSGAFEDAAEKARESAKSVDGLLGQLDLADDTNIERVRETLADVSRDSTLAASALRDKLIPELEAFPGLGEAGQQLLDDLRAAQAETMNLSEAFKSLGVDPETYRSGLSTLEQDTIATFRRISTDPAVTGEQIRDALTASLERVGADAVPQLQAALEEAFEAGIIGQQEFDQAMQATEQALRDTAQAAEDLGQAYRDMTVDQLAQEQAELNRALREGRMDADEHREAVEAISKAYQQLRDDASEARKEQRGASDEAVQGARDAEEATQKAGDTTNIYVGQVKSFAAVLANFYDGIKSDLADLSQAALQRFKEFQGATEPARDGAQQVRDSIAEMQDEIRAIKFDNITAGPFMRWVGDVSIAAREAKIEFAEQSLVVQELEESLTQMANGGSIALGDLNHARQAVQRGFSALDDEQLSGLRGAIDAVERRLQGLRDTAENTLGSLQDELLRLQGREEELEERRLERRRQEIEAQLELAQGDAEATKALQESLRTLEKIGRERKSQAQEERATRREREAAAPDTASADRAPASAPAPTRTVRMELDVAGRRHAFDVLEGQEDQVERLFRSLESQQAVSA
ncbi:hypothetical protein [Thioalkalivibrio sp. ALE6]|uniref:hypothetical protein n=1 Tax=Thioalkalivibrio sp. ALE6 TaxID=1266908 RepID=UPI00035DBCD4|nr:hypothetical protein [Thioalkalivibrio sp. ALE6]